MVACSDTTGRNNNERINLRLSQIAYHQIQLNSIEEGISYQSIISSLAHKYINGMLMQE
jgi:predicted DNA binding CopG/RHH family protein